jgi:hypothetical protein
MADEPRDGSDKNRDAPTVRDLKGPELSSDTLPDVVGLYVPPRPLPEASSHRTLDLRSVRLSDEADPRRALTQLRLESPPVPPPAWRRVRPWLALAAVLLLAAAGGAFFWKTRPAPPEAPTPVQPAAVTKSLVTAAGASRSVPALAPARSAEPAPSATPGEPGPKSGADSPAPAKARPRDSSKKRKDPWLE